MQQKNTCAFRCPSCGHNWTGAPDHIDEAPERDWHPYKYRAACALCSNVCAQAGWEVALFKAHAKATGPRTIQGKARSVANLKGHPTKEETALTRFNALKHGLYAETATFFPARPGKYPECSSCDMFDGCGSQPACQKKTELFMRHHIAYESKDPSLLRGMRASLQAKVQVIIDQIILTLMQDGVSIKTPQWYHDKEGVFCLAEYKDSEGERRLVEDVRAHPLLKTLVDLMSRNGMTLSDDNMTESSGKTDDEQHLNPHGVSPDVMQEWNKRSSDQLSKLEKLIQRSSSVIDVSPVTEDNNDVSTG
jgi:hypothetical protein